MSQGRGRSPELNPQNYQEAEEEEDSESILESI
jgi:hypothetical protein